MIPKVQKNMPIKSKEQEKGWGRELLLIHATRDFLPSGRGDPPSSSLAGRKGRPPDAEPGGREARERRGSRERQPMRAMFSAWRPFEP